MASSWGAALESLGSGLMKYGMTQMEEEKTLEREARADQRALALAKQKAEMEAALEEAAEKRISEQIAAAKGVQSGLLTENIRAQMGAPELARLRSESSQAWERAAAPGVPVTRSGESTEQTAFADMTQAERDIYSRNLQEQADYAATQKPSQSQIDIATAQALRGTKAGGELRKDVTEEIAFQQAVKNLDKSGDLEQYLKKLQADKLRLEIAKLENPEKKGGEVNLTEAQRNAQSAANTLLRMQIKDSDGSTRALTNIEMGVLADYAAKGKANSGDVPANAPLWVRNTIKMYGGSEAVSKLFNAAGGQHLRSKSTSEKGAAKKPWDKNR